MPLANVVLVTGAAGGIGYEIVRTLLAELEAGVVATDIVEGGLQKLKEQYPSRIHIVIGDIVDVCRPATFGEVLPLLTCQKAQDIGNERQYCNPRVR